MCVGMIALFDKALVSALACGALAMCAMWVGFPSSFFCGGGKKKQNKFGSAELHFIPATSNLYCPVIKLNSYYYQFITIVSVGRLSFYTYCQLVYTRYKLASIHYNLGWIAATG